MFRLLAVGKRSARFHRADDIGLRDLLGHQRHLAVVQKNPDARAELRGKRGEGNADFLPASLHLAGGQRKGCAAMQGRLAARKGAQTDFGTFGVQKHRRRQMQPIPDAAERIHHVFVIFMVARARN